MQSGPAVKPHTGAGLFVVAKHRRFEGGCYLVAPRLSLQHPATSPDGIGTLPLDLFLIACGRQAETTLLGRLASPR